MLFGGPPRQIPGNPAAIGGVIIATVYSSLACRALLRAISWVAPREGRDEWFARWSGNFASWRILCERGELRRGSDSDGFFGLCRNSLREAWAARLKVGATQAVVHGPGIVLGAGAALLLLIAVLSGGLHGTRWLFASSLVEDPAALVSIDYPSRPTERAATLARLIPLWRAKSALVRDVAGYRFQYNGPVAWVSWNFFPLLGVRPAAGRLLQSQDRDGAVISYPAWRSWGGGDTRIIGKKIQAAGRNYTVVGILPEGFWALSPVVDIWAPLDLGSAPPGPRFLVGAAGRLRSGAGTERAGRELAEIAKAGNLPARPVRLFALANRLPGHEIDFYLIGALFAGISCLVMVAREHRWPRGQRWHYWPFLAAKIVLAVMLPLLAWIEFDSLVRTFRPALGAGASVARILAALTFLVTCVRGLWWSFADQRRRCPVCLQRLAMPVSVGSPASIFDPAITELVCSNGHGALSLPDNQAGRSDRWIALDSSWGELFGKRR